LADTYYGHARLFGAFNLKKEKTKTGEKQKDNSVDGTSESYKIALTSRFSCCALFFFNWAHDIFISAYSFSSASFAATAASRASRSGDAIFSSVAKAYSTTDKNRHENAK
jgi:hypothetical protein